MFDKELAQRYLDHRTLVSHPKKFEYMREHGFTTLDELHANMSDTANKFNAMMQSMIKAH